MAFCGDEIKTFILAGMAAVLMGATLTPPTVYTMVGNNESPKDLDPTFLSALAAGLLAACHAAMAVARLPPT